MRKKILVIDDSETIRASVREVLTQAGYEVLEAPDGMLGAFTIRERSDLALVILDIAMPRMDGLAMLEVLKGQFPKIPVLMLTTESRPDRLERAKRAGAKAWMLKPFKPDLLLATVVKLLAS